jgi:RNA 2',3'-cyclic 3'-phosphodiesterase
VRLFVALEIPSAVRENLAALIDELRRTDSTTSKHGPRWVRPENLHVTLKFIGHVDAAKLDLICTALSQARFDPPVDIEFRGLGFFPSEKRPRVLWVGIKGSLNLAALANEIDQRLEPLGVARETREFTPHLTLVRFDPPGTSEKLRAAIQKAASEQPLRHSSGQAEMAVPRQFGAFHTGEFHLIESKTKPSGAEYTTLHSFRFAAEA